MTPNGLATGTNAAAADDDTNEAWLLRSVTPNAFAAVGPPSDGGTGAGADACRAAEAGARYSPCATGARERASRLRLTSLASLQIPSAAPGDWTRSRVVVPTAGGWGRGGGPLASVRGEGDDVIFLSRSLARALDR